MVFAARMWMAVVLCGLTLGCLVARGEETPAANAQARAARDRQKVPTKIAGTLRSGELIELRVRERIAFVIRPTGRSRFATTLWVWDFPFWLAIEMGSAVWPIAFMSSGRWRPGFTWRVWTWAVRQPGGGGSVPGVLRARGGRASAARACAAVGSQPRRVDRVWLGVSPRDARRSHRRHVPGGRFSLVSRLGECRQRARGRAGLRSHVDRVRTTRCRVQPDRQSRPASQGRREDSAPARRSRHAGATDANATELARRYEALGGQAEIVLLKDLGAERATSRGHDGPELYESARLIDFLLGE